MCLPSGIILRVPVYTLKTGNGGGDKGGEGSGDNDYDEQFPDALGRRDGSDEEFDDDDDERGRNKSKAGHIIISGSGKVMTDSNYVPPSKLVSSNTGAPMGK